MKLLLIILLHFFWSNTVLSYAPKNPVIYTKNGPIIGSTEQSRKGREYYSYRGIPYAKPPIGNLRFKAPEPVEPWNFAVNATRDAPYCIQKNYFFADPKVEGQEDCLYLNVYVPKTNNYTLLPVMVFIHWGGFFAGRGSSDLIGPEYFMDKDVILVSLNYRLGVFGFFSTLDDAAPGNFGLKDQVMALKFVNENIECFGGNKNRVTLFGQSAGSGSTSLHLVSPLSKGLFQQAISQSGVALDVWAKPFNILQTTVKNALAQFTGCTGYLSENVDLVNCLRNVSATNLAETADKFKYFSIEPLTPYGVVTEIKTDANPNPFLTKEPLEYFQAGEFQKVPYILGNAQDEGILRVAQLTRQPETLQTLNSNFTFLLTQMLGLALSVGPNNTNQLFQDIVKFYLNGRETVDIQNPASVQGFIDLYSDRVFTYGIYQAAYLQSLKGHNPIWLYNFNYKGQYTYGDVFAATKSNIDFNWGVSHCDDLLYLFQTPALFPELGQQRDLALSEDLLTMWTAFATEGDPDPNGVYTWNSLNFTNYENTKNNNFQYLNITGNLETGPLFYLETNYFPERMNFWVQQKLAENFKGLN